MRLSCMQQLHACNVLGICHHAHASLWCQRQALNFNLPSLPLPCTGSNFLLTQQGEHEYYRPCTFTQRMQTAATHALDIVWEPENYMKLKVNIINFNQLENELPRISARLIYKMIILIGDYDSDLAVIEKACISFLNLTFSSISHMICSYKSRKENPFINNNSVAEIESSYIITCSSWWFLTIWYIDIYYFSFY